MTANDYVLASRAWIERERPRVPFIVDADNGGALRYDRDTASVMVTVRVLSHRGPVMCADAVLVEVLE